MENKIITLPNYKQWENDNINVFKMNKMYIAIENAIKNKLSVSWQYTENEIKLFIDNVRKQYKNIPLSITYGDTTYYFNDIIILNEYPLFQQYNMGDCVCIFMIRYFTPYVWENKIFMIDCDGDIKQYDNDIFLSLYYDTEILSL